MDRGRSRSGVTRQLEPLTSLRRCQLHKAQGYNLHVCGRAHRTLRSLRTAHQIAHSWYLMIEQAKTDEEPSAPSAPSAFMQRSKVGNLEFTTKSRNRQQTLTAEGNMVSLESPEADKQERWSDGFQLQGTSARMCFIASQVDVVSAKPTWIEQRTFVKFQYKVCRAAETREKKPHCPS